MSKIKPLGCFECKTMGHICGWCDTIFVRRDYRRTKELDPKYCYSRFNKFRQNK